jgi:membrane protein
MIADFRAFRYLLKGRFWIDLWHEINYDDCWGMAAQLSYYFLLAFVPFLIFLLAVVSFIPVDTDVQSELLEALDRVLPETAYVLVSSIVISLLNNADTGVLSLGLILTLWSASRAFAGMVGVMNRAYEVRDQRSFFTIQLLAVVVTVFFSFFVILSIVLLFWGDSLFRLVVGHATIADSPLLSDWAARGYWMARWLVIFALVNIGMQMAYYTLPARRLPWFLFSPGSIFATMMWVGASKGFSWYVNSFADYQRVYGSLGALVVLMVWFYLSSLLLLVGGEINSEIHRLRKEAGKAR